MAIGDRQRPVVVTDSPAVPGGTALERTAEDRQIPAIKDGAAGVGATPHDTVHDPRAGAAVRVAIVANAAARTIPGPVSQKAIAHSQRGVVVVDTTAVSGAIVA